MSIFPQNKMASLRNPKIVLIWLFEYPNNILFFPTDILKAPSGNQNAPLADIFRKSVIRHFLGDPQNTHGYL